MNIDQSSIMFGFGVILLMFGMALMIFRSADGGRTRIKLPVVELELNGGALFVMVLGAGLMYFANSKPPLIGLSATKNDEEFQRPASSSNAAGIFEEKARAAEEARRAAEEKAASAVKAQKFAEQNAAEAEDARKAAEEKAKNAEQARAAADRKLEEQRAAEKKAESESSDERRAIEQEEAQQKAVAAQEASKAAEEKAAAAEEALKLSEQRAATADEARKAAEEKARNAEVARQASELKAQVAAQAREAADALSKFKLKINRDIPGEDIPSQNGQIGFSTSNIGECALECSASERCLAFAYDGWNEKCYLKGSIVNSLLDPHSTIGVKSAFEIPKPSRAMPELKIRRNNKFKGIPLVRVNVTDFSACKELCWPDLKCVAFSFSKKATSDSNCELFNVSEEGYFAADAIDSGWKQQMP